MRSHGGDLNIQWWLLGGTGSLSLRAALLFIPAGLIGPLLFDPSRFGGSVLTWLLVGIVGEVVLVIGFRLSTGLIHRRRDNENHPTATLVALILVASARGVSIGTCAFALGLTPDLELPYRLGAGVLFAFAALVIIAVVVSAYDQHKRTVAALASEQDHLSTLRSTLEGHLHEVRARLVRQIRESVDPRLREIDDALISVMRGADPSASVTSLREFVEREVRPMSRRLGTRPSANNSTPVPRKGGSRPRVPLPDVIAVADGFKPLSTGILCMAAALPPALRLLDTWRAIGFALSFGLTCMLLILLARTLVRNWNAHPLTAVLVTVPVYMAFGALAISVLPVIGLPTPPFLHAPAVIFCGTVGAASVAYGIVTARQSNSEQQLRTTVEELQITISTLHQHAWIEQRRLAYVIHGRLQSSLHVAALRLTTSTVDPAVIEEIRRDISQAVSELEIDRQQMPTVSAALDEIADLWQGICTVEWSLTPATEECLDSRPVTSQCVTEIAREAIGNAIHHGQATQITCDVARHGDTITVSVSDNGTGWIATSAKGMGSTMFDDLCTTWAASDTQPGTLLQATVAIA